MLNEAQVDAEKECRHEEVARERSTAKSQKPQAKGIGACNGPDMIDWRRLRQTHDFLCQALSCCKEWRTTRATNLSYRFTLAWPAWLLLPSPSPVKEVPRPGSATPSDATTTTSN